jgi:hypothetical protein
MRFRAKGGSQYIGSMRFKIAGLAEAHMAMPTFADPANLMLEEEPEPMLPEGCTAKEALQMELRGEVRLTPSQFRAAKELLPYENPKLTAVAIGHMDQSSFAAALERAILRSKSPPPPAALLPAPEQHPASELKGNFPVRRRNLR